MAEKLDLTKFTWINKPKEFQLKKDNITIFTDPSTDFWERTYYGFRNDNAHAFVIPIKEKEFTFGIKTTFEPDKLFDQCGLVFYQDNENWFKASVEHEDGEYSKLGSVVTNLGYSDWAMVDISSNIKSMFYRLSRRGQDFLIESSLDGISYKQMRIFHMHKAIEAVNAGIYACSPLKSSMKAVFSEISLGECLWHLHANPDE